MTAEVSLAQALNLALDEALSEDNSVFVIGEEITSWADGGLFGVTKGLKEKFGASRVRDVPISEEAVVAAAVGAAMVGLRPVVDINFSDFLLLAMGPIVNQAAKYRYVFGGQHSIPLVIRANSGAALGKGAQHSQSLETVFAHIPGLEVLLPSTPNNAYWLLKQAIASPNPTIVLEHKGLYATRGKIEKVAPVGGRPRVVRGGRDVTVVTSQMMMYRCLEIAARLESEGIGVEVIDLETLCPLDVEPILCSARRTRRVLVCHEAPLLYGFGGELASQIMEECWRELAAPVTRVGGSRTPVPFAPVLETEVVPSGLRIEESIRSLLYQSEFSHRVSP